MNKYLLFSWIAAIIATLGSLYFSEVAGYIPCTLCWYQRIFMYPLAILLGIFFYHHERLAYKYILPLSIIGMILSGYHYSLQKVSFMQKFEMCTSGIPCSIQYINWLGFITIPFLAFIAFTIITICMLFLKKQNS